MFFLYIFWFDQSWIIFMAQWYSNYYILMLRSEQCLRTRKFFTLPPFWNIVLMGHEGKQTELLEFGGAPEQKLIPRLPLALDYVEKEDSLSVGLLEWVWTEKKWSESCVWLAARSGLPATRSGLPALLPLKRNSWKESFFLVLDFN